MPPQPLIKRIDVQAHWDGELSHPIDLEVSFEVISKPNTKLPILRYTDPLVEAVSLLNVTQIAEADACPQVSPLKFSQSLTKSPLSLDDDESQLETPCPLERRAYNDLTGKETSTRGLHTSDQVCSSTPSRRALPRDPVAEFGGDVPLDTKYRIYQDANGQKSVETLQDKTNHVSNSVVGQKQLDRLHYVLPCRQFPSDETINISPPSEAPSLYGEERYREAAFSPNPVAQRLSISKRGGRLFQSSQPRSSRAHVVKSKSKTPEKPKRPPWRSPGLEVDTTPAPETAKKMSQSTLRLKKSRSSLLGHVSRANCPGPSTPGKPSTFKRTTMTLGRRQGIEKDRDATIRVMQRMDDSPDPYSFIPRWLESGEAAHTLFPDSSEPSPPSTRVSELSSVGSAYEWRDLCKETSTYQMTPSVEHDDLEVDLPPSPSLSSQLEVPWTSTSSRLEASSHTDTFHIMPEVENVDGAMFMDFPNNVIAGRLRIDIVAAVMLGKVDPLGWGSVLLPGMAMQRQGEGTVVMTITEEASRQIFFNTLDLLNAVIGNVCLSADFHLEKPFEIPLRIKGGTQTLEDFKIDYELRTTYRCGRTSLDQYNLDGHYSAICSISGAPSTFFGAEKCRFTLFVDGGPPGALFRDLKLGERNVSLEQEERLVAGHPVEGTMITLFCPVEDVKETFILSWIVRLDDLPISVWEPTIHAVSKDFKTQREHSKKFKEVGMDHLARLENKTQESPASDNSSPFDLYPREVMRFGRPSFKDIRDRRRNLRGPKNLIRYTRDASVHDDALLRSRHSSELVLRQTSEEPPYDGRIHQWEVGAICCDCGEMEMTPEDGIYSVKEFALPDDWTTAMTEEEAQQYRERFWNGLMTPFYLTFYGLGFLYAAFWRVVRVDIAVFKMLGWKKGLIFGLALMLIIPVSVQKMTGVMSRNQGAGYAGMGQEVIRQVAHWAGMERQAIMDLEILGYLRRTAETEHEVDCKVVDGRKDAEIWTSKTEEKLPWKGVEANRFEREKQPQSIRDRIDWLLGWRGPVGQ